MSNRLPITALVVAGIAAAGIIATIKYDDWVALPRAREFVTAKLRDPASAQFRNDRFAKTGWLCGEVNAKNGNGGYVGFKRYISSGRGGEQYVEGSGNLGEPSTQDIIDLLDKKTARLKSYSELRAQIPDLKRPSESDIDEQAMNDVFKEKWSAYCD